MNKKSKPDPNELVQYIIVNQDLNMSPREIAAQVAHAATTVAVGAHCSRKNKFFTWYARGQKKIILRAHREKIKTIADLVNLDYRIIDHSHTEIPAGSLTCVTLGIMTRERAKSFVKNLQLL